MYLLHTQPFLTMIICTRLLMLEHSLSTIISTVSWNRIWRVVRSSLAYRGSNKCILLVYPFWAIKRVWEAAETVPISTTNNVLSPRLTFRDWKRRPLDHPAIISRICILKNSKHIFQYKMYLRRRNTKYLSRSWLGFRKKRTKVGFI